MYVVLVLCLLRRAKCVSIGCLGEKQDLAFYFYLRVGHWLWDGLGGRNLVQLQRILLEQDGRKQDYYFPSSDDTASQRVTIC